MKHLYTLAILFSAAIYSAQSLTQSFNEPLLGDVDKNYRLDTSSFSSGLPMNVTGNNCVWDFKALTGAFPMIVDSFVSPANTPNTSSYPGATFVQHRDLLYSYFKSAPQQTELLGAYSPSLSLTFTNSAIIATYPVNYGYNLSDPVGGTFKYNSTNGVCIGNITISADGLGTIQLPNNITIQNVLRLKSVETLTLSTSILTFGTFNQSIYNYYMPGRKFPILSVNYTTYQLIAGTPTVTGYVYGSNDYFTVVGLKESSPDKQEVRVFPNPFHHQLSLQPEASRDKNEFFFYTINGMLALKTRTLSDPEIELLSPGVYFLEIRHERGISHQKLLKE